MSTKPGVGINEEKLITGGFCVKSNPGRYFFAWEKISLFVDISFMKKALFLIFIFVFMPSIIDARLEIVQKGEKYGLKYYDSEKWELRPKYDTIIKVTVVSLYDCFILKKGDKYGIFREIYSTKYELNKPKYVALTGPVNGYFALADKTGNFSLFNSSGSSTTPFQYKQIVLNENYRLFQLKNENWIYPYQKKTYKNDTVFADSIAVNGKNTILFIQRKTKNEFELFVEKHPKYEFDKIAIVNESGQVKTGIEFDPDIGKKVIVLKSESGKAIADESGRIVSPWYKNITHLSNGEYITQDVQRYGIIGKDLNEIFKPKFSELRHESDFYFTRRDEVYNGLFNLTSRKETIYEIYGQNGELLTHSDKQIKKVAPGKYDVSGKLFDVVQRKFDNDVVSISEAGSGFYQIKKDTTYYYIDTSGKKMSGEYPVMYKKTHRDDGLTALFGIFKLITIAPFVVDVASGNNPFVGRGYTVKIYGSGFHENMAVVAIPDKKGKAAFGYIDTSMNLVIPYLYDNATVFYGEIAFVSKKEKWAAINKENKNLSGFIYDEIQPFADNLIIVKQKAKKHPFSFINNKAEKVNIPEFSSYIHESDGTITIEVGNFSGKKYTVTKSGECFPYKNE